MHFKLHAIYKAFYELLMTFTRSNKWRQAALAIKSGLLICIQNSKIDKTTVTKRRGLAYLFQDLHQWGITKNYY